MKLADWLARRAGLKSTPGPLGDVPQHATILLAAWWNHPSVTYPRNITKIARSGKEFYRIWYDGNKIFFYM